MNVSLKHASPIAADRPEGALCTSRRRLSALRQAQLIAGSFVLVGTFFSSLWVLAPIVGAGLLFAGATGICPMERLLARLPWNSS